MLTKTPFLSRSGLLGLALSASLLSPLTMAASPNASDSDINTRYQADVS